MFRILHLAITGELVPDNAEYLEYEYGAEAVAVAQARSDVDGATRHIVDASDNTLLVVSRNESHQ